MLSVLCISRVNIHAISSMYQQGNIHAKSSMYQQGNIHATSSMYQQGKHTRYQLYVSAE
jgi:hypothetical protein